MDVGTAQSDGLDPDEDVTGATIGSGPVLDSTRLGPTVTMRRT